MSKNNSKPVGPVKFVTIQHLAGAGFRALAEELHKGGAAVDVARKLAAIKTNGNVWSEADERALTSVNALAGL